MRKRDFMELDNPLLAWMLDYDAVTACLRPLSLLRGVKQEQMEQLLDRFDAREEMSQGQTIVSQGDLVRARARGLGSPALLHACGFRAMRPREAETRANGACLRAVLCVLCAAQVDKLYVCKIGEVQVFRDGQPTTDPAFVKESGGFTYFGDDALKEPFKSKYTVKVRPLTPLLSLFASQLLLVDVFAASGARAALLGGAQ